MPFALPIKVKFALQVRQRPESYKIGQETIGATKKGKKIDDYFDNNQIEWYTKENIAIAINGLLVQFYNDDFS